jgi:hypothetical protein
MRKLLALVLIGSFGLAGLAGAAEKAKAAPKSAPQDYWEDRIEQAMDNTGAFDWKDAALTDVLQVIGKAVGAAVVLDPKAVPEPDKVKITLSIPKENPVALRSILGNVLKLAGLRYTLKDQAIFVSTRERLVAELLAPTGGPTPVVPGVNAPLTAGDASAATVDFFDGSEEFIPQTVLETVRGPVDARFEKPAYRDAQGRLHFTPPPMIIADPETLNPAHRFDTKPYFLLPEYLAPYYWGPQSQAVKDDAPSVKEVEALKALVDYMKKHPELTIGQLIQQLEALQVKEAAPKAPAK